MTNLKQLPQWCNWKYIPDPDHPDKPRKMPINSKTGGNAQSNNPSTWATYEVAEREAHKYDGIGFMFANGYAGIDLDNKKNDPEFEERAADIIQMMNTYTEYSPSGTGYHLPFRCDISRIPTVEVVEDGITKIKLDPAYYQKNPHNDVECYFSGLTNRFFTYTGEAVNQLEIEDRTEEVLNFLDKYMKKRPQQNANSAEGKAQSNVHSSNSNIITIARKAKNSKKFCKLFDEGDISDYNNDDSSADQALCNMLAFYCQGDADMIDQFFRQSKLYREKWERADYRNGTILKAIALCDDKFYRPPGRPKKEKGYANPYGGNKLTSDIVSVEAVQSYLDEQGITLKYNEITRNMDIAGLDSKYGEENKADILPVVAYNDLKFIYDKCPKGDVKDALSVIASVNRYNPVIEMLNSAEWDGVDRIQELFTILHIGENDRLSRTLIYKWLWQCLSMLRNEVIGAYGADGILVLQGAQGIGKTTLARTLAITLDFFIEGLHLDVRDKDTLILATSAWISELGEIGKTFKSDIDALKAFITKPKDNFRLPYGRAPVNIARHTSFIGTCNNPQFLVDETGNRRFWSVPITAIDLDALAKFDALQLWLQVDKLTQANRQGFRLNRDEQAQLAERNSKHEKPLKAEMEILDIIYKADNPDMKSGVNLEYRAVTVTEFKKVHSSLKYYSVEQISQALTKLGIEPAESKKIDGKTHRLRRLPMWDYGNSNDDLPE